MRDPLPLEQVLLEISSKGKITIRFNREKLKDQKLLRTLAPHSVGMALEELAFRKQAHLVYHSKITFWRGFNQMKYCSVSFFLKMFELPIFFLER